MKKKSPKHGPLAQNIKTLREAAGLTQEEAAVKFSISRGAWCTYEQDRATPGAQLSTALCNYFGITTEQLFKELITKEQLNTTGRTKSAIEIENEALKRELELLKELLAEKNKRLALYESINANGLYQNAGIKKRNKND